jgi:quinol monooxygenase YgiN
MSEGHVHVLTHVDIVPPKVDEGTDLLLEFVADTRDSPGLVRSKLLRQTARKNHFELLWVWRTQEDYERHLRDPATRRFRERLKPLVGSPLLDRVHTPVGL